MRRSRSLRSTSPLAPRGGSPIQLTANCQLCPVFRVVAFNSKVGAFAARRQLSSLGLKSFRSYRGLILSSFNQMGPSPPGGCGFLSASPADSLVPLLAGDSVAFAEDSSSLSFLSDDSSLLAEYSAFLR